MIVVADSYQASVGTLATILEYIAIRHRYSDKENEFAEEVERALQSLTSLIPPYNFDQGQGYCKSSPLAVHSRQASLVHRDKKRI